MLASWEVERIKARIELAKRRIASGVVSPDKRGESEQDRLARLEKLLEENN